jgi:hypothetical protein
MLDFYKTQGGRRFFDGTIPKLVEALQSIALSLGKLVKAAEASAATDSQEGSWVHDEDGPEGHYLLDRPLTLFGRDFHVEAVETRYDEVNLTQEPLNEEHRTALDALYVLAMPDAPLETVEIDGRQHVVIITPHAQ